MEAASSRGRLAVLTVLVLLGFVGLGCRLVDVQWTRHQEFVALAQNQHDRVYIREAPRGDIRDRRGNLLATSVPVKRVCADPSLLKGFEIEMARVLAPLLRTNEADLVAYLTPRSFTNKAGLLRPVRYQRLKEKVPLEEWDKIRLALQEQYTNATAGRKLSYNEKTRLQGVWQRAIAAQDDQVRTYPNGQLASHILGFMGPKTEISGDETNEFSAGVEGIESTFNEKLSGARGWVKTETDIRNRELFLFREQDVEPRPGMSVVLTIDARIQQIVEEEIAPLMAKHSAQSASAIVIRPRTGEILAMANYPTFNPNTPGKFNAASRRNRIITDPFEPGSTAKIITLAGALNDGTVRLTDTFDCNNGIFYFAGKPLHDHEHYGVLSVQQIIAKSSNIGTAKVAIRMGQERAFKYFLDFGFGERTGIPLPSEARGYLPALKHWKPIHVSRITIGHGASATQLQTAMAFCAVANGGVLMKSMLVDSLVDAKGSVIAKYQPQAVRRVISESVAKRTVEALKTVVEKGTAEKAALDHYTVAGKTGTAQKVVDGVYSHEKYFSSFIGFFPASDPELCISIGIDEPAKKSGYYGGQIAGPVFKRIAERAANFLNVKPDLIVEEPGDIMASSNAQERAVASAATR
jgi:cell division protein FtsI/penicillin-binding protein 2